MKKRAREKNTHTSSSVPGGQRTRGIEVKKETLCDKTLKLIHVSYLNTEKEKEAKLTENYLTEMSSTCL